jgi:hypothetical protein
LVAAGRESRICKTNINNLYIGNDGAKYVLEFLPDRIGSYLLFYVEIVIPFPLLAPRATLHHARLKRGSPKKERGKARWSESSMASESRRLRVSRRVRLALSCMVFGSVRDPCLERRRRRRRGSVAE